MFEHAGSKLKIIAVWAFALEILAAAVASIILYSVSQNGYMLLIFPCSLLPNLISNLALYAFGELCENVEKIANNSSSNIIGISKSINQFQPADESDNDDDELPSL